MASGQAAPTNIAVPEPSLREQQTEFAARWPDLTGARDLDGAEFGAASSAYAEKQAPPDAVAHGPVNWPLVTERASPASQDDAALQTASLAGGAALALLFFAGWVLKANGRPRLPRSAQLAEIDGRAWAAPRYGGSATGLPTPTDPAVNLKTSLAELMRDLRRADGGSGTLRSLQRPVAPARARWQHS